MAQTHEMDLEGTVEKIVFCNPTNGWTVLRLKIDKKTMLATVVGAFQSLNPGERVKFQGEWKNDPKHGKQFKAQTCLPQSPATQIGIQKFLASGLVPGIGEVMAKRMVKKFGLKTLEVIENNPARLSDVEGIGPKRALAISKAMVAKRQVRDVMVFLESCGVSPAFAHRIYLRYGKDAIRKVSDNPYCLASDVRGMGFLSADKIANHLGIKQDSPYRAEAGILYTLEDFASSGHVFAHQGDLVYRASELLKVDVEILEEATQRLSLMGKVRREGEAKDRAHIYLPRLYQAENNAAADIRRLLNGKAKPLPLKPQTAIQRAEKIGKMALAEAQRAAFYALATAKIMVLTGGPGTGKTTLLKGLVSCLLDQKLSVVLCAPTGRASRRMGESAGMPASTIHRLLEFTPKSRQFERCRENPLKQDVIVVDEMSMVDMELFEALVAASKTTARLILVGDPDQLPSVGPGSVLNELLSLKKSQQNKLAIVRLTEIFRQARTSFIVTGAHAVLQGTAPKVGEKGSTADLFLVEKNEPEEILSVIKNLVAKRIPQKFGFDPIEGIQVLTPMHKGIIGSENLNREIQALLNPQKKGITSRHVQYKPGDKVMQIRNNYDLEVFNGDIGKITAIGEENAWLEISYLNKKVRYPATELDQITLAYACSIHKSQGSEYPAVIIPIHTQHFVMLQRNLLYTAMTRGKKLVVIVGSKKALQIAIKNDSQTIRNTNLADKIQHQYR